MHGEVSDGKITSVESDQVSRACEKHRQRPPTKDDII